MEWFIHLLLFVLLQRRLEIGESFCHFSMRLKLMRQSVPRRFGWPLHSLRPSVRGSITFCLCVTFFNVSVDNVIVCYELVLRQLVFVTSHSQCASGISSQQQHVITHQKGKKIYRARETKNTQLSVVKSQVNALFIALHFLGGELQSIGATSRIVE